MATKDIIKAASDPLFYTRVAFIALKAAQNVANEAATVANHANRVKYAGLVFSGKDSALALTLHIAASNPTIANTLGTKGGAAVLDSEIEYAMGQIWDSRANAFA
jgi:hypothetical protein